MIAAIVLSMLCPCICHSGGWDGQRVTGAALWFRTRSCRRALPPTAAARRWDRCSCQGRGAMCGRRGLRRGVGEAGEKLKARHKKIKRRRLTATAALAAPLRGLSFPFATKAWLALSGRPERPLAAYGGNASSTGGAPSLGGGTLSAVHETHRVRALASCILRPCISRRTDAERRRAPPFRRMTTHVLPPAKERAVGLSWTDLCVRAVVGSENACAVVDISAGNLKKIVPNSALQGGAVLAPSGQTRQALLPLLSPSSSSSPRGHQSLASSGLYKQARNRKGRPQGGDAGTATEPICPRRNDACGRGRADTAAACRERQRRHPRDPEDQPHSEGRRGSNCESQHRGRQRGLWWWEAAGSNRRRRRRRRQLLPADSPALHLSDGHTVIAE